MTNKDKYIANIRKARTEHNKWLHRIKLVVSGFEKNRHSVSLNQSESPFGVWLENEAILFSSLNTKTTLLEIESLFNECYSIYHKIYNIIFNVKTGFLSSLLGTNKLSSSDILVSENYYEELVKTSDMLINKMRVYENQVRVNSTEKFDDIYQEEQLPLTTETKTKEERYYRGSLISDE